MLLLLFPSLFGCHAAFLNSHAHLLAHIVVILLLVLRAVCTLTTNQTPAICAFPAPTSSCAANNARRISVTLLPSLLSASTIDD
tara:strand:- start:11429 stop:11680 length:252 start_codon:yes stop_codon:yes gene_type:complete